VATRLSRPAIQPGHQKEVCPGQSHELPEGRCQWAEAGRSEGKVTRTTQPIAVNDDKLVTRTSPDRTQRGGDMVFFVQCWDDDEDRFQASVFGSRNAVPSGQVFWPINVRQWL
jgi:hypothetical protein